MALNYLSGRVSRFAVGVPGFSTAQDLTLAVSGALGVETFRPRAEIDTPNISIRGAIYDAGIQTGGVGYFLSQDIEGVKWVAASPIDLTFVRVFDNDAYVGPSNFSGLNFKSNDDEFVTITPNPTDPELADIVYDVRWVRNDYGPNKGISTGFGTDGTYASIPGFGTSEAVGVTSVGIGTNMPQDDFQVGIGSTGVTINGPLGKVEAEIIKADNIEVDGNLTVESLVVAPGIATLTNLEVVDTAQIPTEYVGFSSIQSALIDQLEASQILAGLTTLGFGGEDVFILDDLFVQGGLGTFRNDVFIGGDLTVAGDVFFKQINAENIIVSGVSTLNQVEALGIAVTDFAVSGFSTLSDISFNVGVGTDLELESIRSGLGTFGIVDIGESVIGFATIGEIESDKITVGFLTATDIVSAGGTIGGLEAEGDLVRIVDLFVTGLSTFVGVGTFRDNLFVGADLFVKGDVTFRNINAEQLLITGIGTINDLESNVGIVTTLFVEDLQNISGVSTLRVIESQQINVGVLTANSIFATDIDADRGRVGFLTGRDLNYVGVGTIETIEADLGVISSINGNTLNVIGFSFVNGVQFGDFLTIIGRDLLVTGITTFVGLGTFGDDLYVRNDLFVGGTLNFRQLTGENILITGIGTYEQIEINTGIATFIDFDTLEVGIATASNIDAGFIDSVVIDSEELVVSGLATISQQLSDFIGVGTIFINEAQANKIQSSSLDVTGIGTINELNFVSGLGTFLKTVDQEIVGVATINELDVNEIDVEKATVGDLRVTGVTTFDGRVNIDKVEFVELNVTGVSSIAQLFFDVGIGTDLEVTTLRAGIATIGLLSATDAEITNLEVFDSQVAQETVADLQVTNSLRVTGPSTFVGFTTFSGDVFVNGDFTVTGITSFSQLDARQSQIGILTVFDILDSQGITTTTNLTVTEDFQSLGVSTIGLSTFKNGDLNINRNLTVGGIVTFQNTVNIDKVEFVELNVTGVSSITKLYVNSGLATQFGVDNFGAQVGFITDLSVTGASTFVGLASFTDAEFQNITVSGLSSLTDAVISGVTTIADARIAREEVGFSSVQQQLVGISTIDQLFIKDSVTSSGVATFIGDVQIQSTLDVQGDTTLTNLQATGISTLNSASIIVADIDVLNANDATIGTSRIGFSSISFLETQDLKVVGPSTFSGDIFLDGNLFVTGVATYGQLDAEQSQIGILTVSEYLDTNDLIVSGLATFQREVNINADINITADILMTGIITATTFDIVFGRVGVQTVGLQRVVGVSTFESDINVLGDANINTATIGVATVGFASVGVATIGIATIVELDALDLTVSGLSTFNDDAYFADNVFIEDNLFVAGVTTFAQLNADQSIIGILTVSNFNPQDINQSPTGFTTLSNFKANSGVVTSLDVEELDVERLVAGLATATDLNVTQNLVVGGISSLGAPGPSGFTTTLGDLYVGGDLFVRDDIFKDEIVGKNAYITGIATINQLFANTGIITTLSATDFDANTGIITNLRAEFAEIGGYIGTSIQVRDLAVTGPSTFVGVASFIDDVFANQDLTVGGNVQIDGATRTNSLVVDTLLRADTGILTTLNVQVASATTANVTTDLTVGGHLESNTFLTGIATVSNIDVLGIASLSNARVDAAFINNLTFNTGFGTFLSLQQSFTGIGTIQFADISEETVAVSTVSQQYVGLSSIGSADIVNATIENLDFDQGTGDFLFTQELQVGVATVLFTNVNEINVGVATISQEIVGVSSIGSANITNAQIESLTYEQANGDFLFSDEIQVGVITATYSDSLGINAGIATITQLDIQDVTSHFAARLETSSTSTQPIFFTNDLSYRSYEITIQAVGGPNVHSTKIHAAHDGSSAIFNEYSTIFNNFELGDYNVDLTAGTLSITVAPATAGIITFTSTIIGMKA